MLLPVLPHTLHFRFLISAMLLLNVTNENPKTSIFQSFHHSACLPL